MSTFFGQRGYTLLFAVFTAALVLGVAAFIVGIARKQYIISATARDSTYSLYAADSGIECAVQAGAVSWTTTDPSVSIPCGDNDDPIPTASFGAPDASGVPDIFDAGNPGGLVQAPPSGNGYIQFPLRDLNSGTTVIGCVRMKVWVGYDSEGVPRTVVESRGYNLCDPITFAPASSPRTVERAMRLTQ